MEFSRHRGFGHIMAAIETNCRAKFGDANLLVPFAEPRKNRVDVIFDPETEYASTLISKRLGHNDWVSTPTRKYTDAFVCNILNGPCPYPLG
jgi:hypothetical protein